MGVKKSRQKGEGPKDRNPRAQRNNARFARRTQEDVELQELERRIRAEAPPPGRAGDFGADDKEEKNSGGEDGPALTKKLFEDLPISSRTKKGLHEGNFVKMTEIQRSAIPRALCGRDILGEAKTGSGKTLAFLIPMIELLFRQQWNSMDGFGGLVVSPTKELAYQIFQVLNTVGSEHELSAGCVVGGRPFEQEQKGVSRMNMLIATPGRLLQHLDESIGFDASPLQMLVFDEADRILDFGFQETVHNILGHLPSERQTLLFSATLRAGVQRLSRMALKSPEIVSMDRGSLSRTPEKLSQVYMVVPLPQKIDLLFSFLRSHSKKKIIVFVSACKQVRFLYEAFLRLKPGPAVMELHGRQTLTKRLIIFQEFTQRKSGVCLICTDIAARGVDFPSVDWVVQMDCPDTVDSYIHRVGRTARYNKSGKSALFLLPSEEAFAQKLAEARVTLKGISAKQNKVHSIQRKLSSVLASEGPIKHLAQKAFLSYMRSMSIMSDKQVFKVDDLPKQEFVESLGLVDIPESGVLGEDADLEQNPLKKQKNATPLQRLKEKIKEKKKQTKRSTTPEEEKEAEQDAELKDDLEEAVAKKLGKWERRQLRIAKVSASAKENASIAMPERSDDADNLLELADSPVAADAKIGHSSLKKRKLKIRDGKAAGAEGKHVFFTGKEGRQVEGEFAQIVDELRNESFEGSASGRAAFLRSVAKDLAGRDKSDASAARLRIHERHQKRRRREKEDMGMAASSSDEEAVAQLGNGSASEAPEASQASDSSCEELQTGPKKAQMMQYRDKPISPASDDPLGALERQVLGKLGGSLFS